MTILNPFISFPATGGFDVETDIAWHSLWYPRSAEYVALGYSDGANVTSLPNVTAEADASHINQTAPTHVAASTPLNGQPAINFTNLSARLDVGTFTASIPTSGGVTVVYWGEVNDVQPSNRRGPLIATAGGGEHAGIFTNNGNWELLGDQGSPETDAVGADNGTYLLAAYFTATGSPTADDVINVNGADTTAINAARNNADIDSAIIGNNANTGQSFSPNGHGGGWGLYVGDIRSDSAWEDFKSWVSDEYGITIA